MKGYLFYASISMKCQIEQIHRDRKEISDHPGAEGEGRLGNDC